LFLEGWDEKWGLLKKQACILAHSSTSRTLHRAALH
jgi:hypothetical protein